ncbi:hypothetical protein FRB90_005313 [Tulasnella sp. 427]|nr:hypothetical protein FRB90_005313 [Tulasnella sp. 427]
MIHIDTLPPELLSLIFLALRPDVHGDLNYLLSSGSTDLLHVLLTCQHWYAVACRVPRLWTTVFIVRGYAAITRAEAYIERAKNFPLNFVIIPSSYDYPPYTSGEVFTHVVSKHCSCVNSIIVPFFSPYTSAGLAQLFPNLEFLRYTPKQSRIDRNLVYQASLNAPKLQKLVLHDVSVEFGEEWPSSLQELEYICARSPPWRLISASQGTLETLILGHPFTTIPPMQSSNADDLPPKSLPKLAKLRLMGPYPTSWSVLRLCDMPVLESLEREIGGFHQLTESATGNPGTFENLRSLSVTIASSGSLGPTLRFLFSCVPNVTEVTITAMYPQGMTPVIPLLQAASGIPKTPLCCPLLKSLILRGRSIRPTELKNLVQLRVPVLQSIHVDSGQGIDHEDRGKIDNLKREEALLRFLRSKDYTVSPQMIHINSLPPELLGLIFAARRQDLNVEAKSLLSQQSNDLLEAFLTCQHWYTVACQVPRLWTRVFIAPRGDATSRAQTYIDRAKNLPIDIIVLRSSSDYPPYTSIYAFQEVVSKHSSRLNSIIFPFFAPYMSSGLAHLLPNLSSLSYTPGVRPIFADVVYCISLKAPKLQKLVLNNTLLDCGEEWPSSLQDLEYICTRDPPWKLLNASQETLESLALGHFRTTTLTERSNNDGSPPRSLPKLSKFRLILPHLPSWRALKLSEMPALESLELQVGDLRVVDESAGDKPPIFKALRSLSIAFVRSNEPETSLQSILVCFPSVTEVTITNDWPRTGTICVQPFLMAAEGTPKTPLLCPLLKLLSLRGRPVRPTELKKLVKLRLPVLQTVHVDGGQWTDGDRGNNIDNLSKDEELLEWLRRKVQLTGLRGWWGG